MKKFFAYLLAAATIVSVCSGFVLNLSAEIITGVTHDADGEIRYYENGVAVAKGLVRDTDGSYYFFNSTKKAVRNCDYSFNELAANGFFPAGKYTFGEDGKMIMKNGIVVDSDGEIRYYENAVASAKGLIKDDEGNYYFFNSRNKAVRNCDYAFSEESGNGLFPGGLYTFDADGKMVMKNGIVADSDGEIRYYKNSVALAKGLVKDDEGNYYFFNGKKKAVRNCDYAFSEESGNGLLPGGLYTFGSDGKMITGDLPDLPADQQKITEALNEIPLYYEQYYTTESVQNLNNIKNAIETNRYKMTQSEADAAVSDLKNAVSSLEYKTSDILQIFITTENSGNVPSEYVPCSIAIVPSSENETPFLFDASSQVKVRGNSTALASKKPYNIKLSSKEDLCGMGKSKKWALLANAYDKALIRNKIALDLGASLGVDYMSSSTFVDVWVDGKLMGNYMLVENIEAGSSRVDINPDNGDFLLEYEAHREESDVEYITTRRYRLRFALNEPEILTDSQYSQLSAYLSAFESALASGDWSRVEALIDVDSFVNFYILSEYLKQVDFAFSSTRFYIKDGIFHAGPGWDYDLSMGNVGARLYDDYLLYNNYRSGTYSGNSWEGSWCYKFKWFERLLSYSEFKSAVKSRFEEVSPILVNLFETNELGMNLVDRLVSENSASFDRNYEIWSITEDDLDDNLAVTRTPDPTFDENIDYLRTWLRNRYNYLAEVFGNY